jgi:hypothetical protein
VASLFAGTEEQIRNRSRSRCLAPHISSEYVFSWSSLPYNLFTAKASKDRREGVIVGGGDRALNCGICSSDKDPIDHSLLLKSGAPFKSRI